MQTLFDLDDSMQINLGLITITYSYCGPGITTTITCGPDNKPVTSFSRLLETHQATCDELKSELKNNRTHFELILSGYLCIMDAEAVRQFIDWFDQVGNRVKCQDCYGTGRVPMFNRDIDCDCIKGLGKQRNI